MACHGNAAAAPSFGWTGKPRPTDAAPRIVLREVVRWEFLP